MKTIIIGIGNILLRDDGVGIHTIHELQKRDLPSTIEVVDGGTSTMNLMSYFIEYPKIIVVDSLKGGMKPGTLYKIKPEDIRNYKKENLSIHDVQILDVVKMVNMLGYSPNVTIFGIEPEEITFHLEMTETMIKSVPVLIEHILQEVDVLEAV